MIPSSYRSGQVINILFLQSAQIGQFSGTIIPDDNTLGSYYKVAGYNYTPLHASSKIIVDYGCIYGVDGNSTGGSDEFDSTIKINNVLVARRDQRWLQSGGVGTGTGTRGSTLFPITGGASNTSLGEKNIEIFIRRWSGDDKIAFSEHYSEAYMRITEIGA